MGNALEAQDRISRSFFTNVDLLLMFAGLAHNSNEDIAEKPIEIPVLSHGKGPMPDQLLVENLHNRARQDV